MTPEAATPLEGIEAIAGRLLNQDILAVKPATGGGNNRVFCVTAENGPYALKFYPPQEEDPRDRLGHEFSALEFLTANGIDCVPTPVAANKDLRCGVYEWIDGAPEARPKNADINTAIDFVQTLTGLENAPGAKKLPMASEACLSAIELCRQLAGRLERLTAVAGTHPALARFLESDLTPARETFEAAARNAYEGAGFDFKTDIDEKARILSPSDFGFHNVLRTPQGKNVFLDFEYFGWDDPVKLTADFLLHPGHDLKPHGGKRFFQGVAPLFAGDSGFSKRLSALYPLYGLRWCMIILAEFLPERMARRQFAGRHADADIARAMQLDKTRARLETLTETNGAFPYGN